MKRKITKKDFVSFDEVKHQMFTRRGFREAYDALEPKYTLINAVLDARNKKGMIKSMNKKYLYILPTIVAVITPVFARACISHPAETQVPATIYLLLTIFSVLTGMSLIALALSKQPSTAAKVALIAIGTICLLIGVGSVLLPTVVLNTFTLSVY